MDTKDRSLNLHGRIKTVNSKGYGFITTKDGFEFFFHYSTFSGMTWRKLVAEFFNNPDKIMNVTFDVDRTSEDGLRATNVRLLVEPRTGKGSLD